MSIEPGNGRDGADHEPETISEGLSPSPNFETPCTRNTTWSPGPVKIFAIVVEET